MTYFCGMSLEGSECDLLLWDVLGRGANVTYFCGMSLEGSECDLLLWHVIGGERM